MFAYKTRPSAAYVAAPQRRIVRVVGADEAVVGAGVSPALAMQKSLAAWAGSSAAPAEYALSVRQSAAVIGGITAMLWCAIGGGIWLAIG